VSKPLILMDFDGTITRRDTTLWLIKELLSINWAKLPIVFLLLVKMYFAKRKDPDQLQSLKCKCVGFLLRGNRSSGVVQSLDRFQNRVREALRPEVKPILSRAAKGEIDILIVTASSEIAVAHAMQDYHVKVIGTRFEKENDRFTGQLTGEPCYGKAKVKQVEGEYSNRDSIWSQISEGWGDSKSDWHLMKLCRNRFWTLSSASQIEEFKLLDPKGNFLLCK
jgi:HAD superfamily phosphoserine phosphatase-like hydrolase